MTHTTNATLTDVSDMVVVHRAFRREFTLIAPLVRAVPAGDTARTTVLTDTPAGRAGARRTPRAPPCRRSPAGT